MHVTIFTPYPEEGPSTRFRISQYIPFLETHGVSCTLSSFLSSKAYKHIFLDGSRAWKAGYYLQGIGRRSVELLKSQESDLLLVHKSISPVTSFFETRWIRKNNNIVFDFDDAEFLRHSSAVNRWSALLKRPDKTRELIEMSRYVIAGNSFLAEYAQRYNSNVVVIPTAIDTNRYRPAVTRRSDNITRVGWIGSSASSRYLELVDEVFEKLLSRHRNLEIVVIGSRGYRPRDSRVQLRPWIPHLELSDLHSLDVGLMPLTDDEYSKGKCGFKAIQYMAVGVPPVVSPVGANVEIVRDGENGFYATRPAEWLEKIEVLINDPGLRERMGQAARQTVECKYSVRINAPKLLAVLRRCVGNHKRAADRYGVKTRLARDTVPK